MWTWLDKRDGLAGDTVNAITHDAKGALWFGALDGGLTRYQRSHTKPKVHIVSVTTDQTYHELDAVGDLTTGTRAIFTYNAIDFKTLPEKRQYRVRIVGENDDLLVDWRVTKEPSFDHLFTDAGIFTFEVQAIDRDLNYSQTASLTLTVVLPWYQNGWILYPSASGIFILLTFSSFLGYRYYQERQRVVAYQREAVEELADARRVQMGLMPEIAPQVEELEIAGRCVSANTVSGDFFDYLQGSNEITIVVGDVTGHGMRGAMNAMMTNGVLRMAAEKSESLTSASLMSDLNNVLVTRMEDQMNVTMVIGLINSVAKTLTLANAGHHAHPLLVRGGTVEPLVSKGMPLGMMAGISYREFEFQLQSGDVLVFMTDGIIEAKDSDGQEYQETDRLHQVIAQFTPDTSAEVMVQALIDDATTFGANMTAEEEDDITVVVVKVL